MPNRLIPEAKSWSEKQISGEYWLDENGDSMYADGDYGDMNHEAYAIERCVRTILEYFGIDLDDDSGILDEHTKEMRDAAADEELGPDATDEQWSDFEKRWWDGDLGEVVLDHIIRHHPGIDKDKLEKTIDIARGNGDARRFAIMEWGWSRVAYTNIETRELTRDTLKTIADGILNILDQEGIDLEDDDPESEDSPWNVEYNISTYTGPRYEITLRDMESGNVEGLQRADIEQTNTAATRQVRQMDVAAMPDYYKNKPFGDSVLRHSTPIFEQTFRRLLNEVVTGKNRRPKARYSNPKGGYTGYAGITPQTSTGVKHGSTPRYKRSTTRIMARSDGNYRSVVHTSRDKRATKTQKGEGIYRVDGFGDKERAGNSKLPDLEVKSRFGPFKRMGLKIANPEKYRRNGVNREFAKALIKREKDKPLSI